MDHDGDRLNALDARGSIAVGAWVSQTNHLSVSVADVESWDDIELPDDAIFAESSVADSPPPSQHDNDDDSMLGLETDGEIALDTAEPPTPYFHASWGDRLPSSTQPYPGGLQEDEHDPFEEMNLASDEFDAGSSGTLALPTVAVNGAGPVRISTIEETSPFSCYPSNRLQAWAESADHGFENEGKNASTDHAIVGLATAARLNPTAAAASAAEDDEPDVMDLDFDFSVGDMQLKLAPHSLTSGRMASAAAETFPDSLDLAADGWGDSLCVHKDLPSVRQLASPTPSSTASIVASESEEDAFDDLEFPDSVEALRLGTYHHGRQHQDREPEGEDDGEEPFAGLLIPEDDSFAFNYPGSRSVARDHSARAKRPVHSQPPPPPPPPPSLPPPSSAKQRKNAPRPASPRLQSRAGTPSKIPRAIPSPMPTPPKPETSRPAAITTVRSSTRPNLAFGTRASLVSPVSPSVGHMKKLSSQLITSRRLGTDSSRAPSKLHRTPTNAPVFGDGTELDGFDDLPVSPVKESRFVKKQKAPASAPVVAAKVDTKWTRQPLPKRPLSKCTSTTSIISGDERENRRPYTPVAPVCHRPAQNFVERRGGTGTHKKRQRKKPTLIKNLNNSDLVKYVGEMVYNPTLQKWEGNEDALLDFDRASPSRPALITNVGGYKLPQSVGGMVFDPVRMCWLGNDEDGNIFADFPDDISVISSAPSGPALQQPTEFQLSKALREAICIAESSHKLFMGTWYPKAIFDGRTMIRDTSKTHLYDIRSHAKGGGGSAVERRKVSLWR
ncbi:hypothetical protein HDU86_005246 [Geranomyces michiganensis]|nr:hypothetical protein HDU86_005246 [Geranomyces michiganensis]